MKRIVCCAVAAIAVIMSTQAVLAQAQLVNDQNPAYLASQNKYTSIADSANAWHSTTIEDTYKAIDYLEDKKEARALRKAYRQERSRDSWYYDDGYYNNYYNNSYYQGGYYPAYRYGFRNSLLYNTLPLALTLGLWYR